MQAKASGEEEGKREGTGKEENGRERWQLFIQDKEMERKMWLGLGSGGVCRDELRPTD